MARRLIRNRTVMFLMLLSVLGLGARGLSAIDSTWLITPDRLAALIGSRAPIVLLHIGDKAEYDAEHIPGAQFISLQDVSDPDAKLRLQMASVDRLRAAFQSRGIGDNTRVVLYMGKDFVTPTARVFVALDYLGLSDRVSILDGGMPAWKATGHRVTAETKPATPGHLTVHPRTDVIVTSDWINDHLADAHVKVLDARTPDFYTGERAGSFPRPGHIAGAGNVPFDTLTDATTLTFKDLAALRQQLENAGAKPGAEVVTYCHIGQQASALYFVAKLLGYHVHLYDGSFEEWSANPSLPVTRGGGK